MGSIFSILWVCILVTSFLIFMGEKYFYFTLQSDPLNTDWLDAFKLRKKSNCNIYPISLYGSIILNTSKIEGNFEVKWKMILLDIQIDRSLFSFISPNIFINKKW